MTRVAARILQQMHTVGSVFDPRANGLNAVRLVLAATVIVYHSFPLAGLEIRPAPLYQALQDIPVDGFFAISGFLIVSSWVRRPQWWPFLRARMLRILPGLYACLVVTAVVVAPLGLLLGGEGLPPTYAREAGAFVLDGLDLRFTSYGIGDTPATVPYPEVWNGSLWTLFWEFLCYLGVLAAGIFGILRWRWSIPLVFALALAVQLLYDLGPLDGNFWAKNLSRFGLMFAAGALVWLWQDRLPAGRWWAVGAAGVLVAGLFLPDYRVVAAFPLAYLVLYIGAVARDPRWRFRNDLSYGVYIYGFPVQQALALVGATRWGMPAYMVMSLLGTAPLAAASWWWVEKPSLRLKGIRRPATVQEAVTVKE
ncbi:MAG: acyltransferase [Actinotalea sp.]|nr:acyltransferase [Actinotalea sp.]